MFSLEGGMGLRCGVHDADARRSRGRPKEIAAGDVWIATGTDEQIAGVFALAPGEGRWPINPGLKQTKRDAIQSLQSRLIGIDKGIRRAQALDTD